MTGRQFRLPIVDDVREVDDAGAENTLADWMSRLFRSNEIARTNKLPDISTPLQDTHVEPGDQVLVKVVKRKIGTVHGGKVRSSSC